MKHLVMGTAGHVDHGKTALIKSLTGVDTDRLPEEKTRGMTTALGFAAATFVWTLGEIEGDVQILALWHAGILHHCAGVKAKRII